MILQAAGSNYEEDNHRKKSSTKLFTYERNYNAVKKIQGPGI